MTEATDAKALYRAFLACLVIASLPIKNLAYITPALYLAIILLHGEWRVVGRFILVSAAILQLSLIAVLWDHLAGRTVNPPGVGMGLVTYAPLFVLLCERFNRTVDQVAYDRFVTVCIWFILLQSVIGVLQFAVTRNTDAVCGSFGLLDGLRQSITIAQVYFTFTMLGMILFLVPSAGRMMPRVAIAIGSLTCVLAQSGHQMVFFVAALVICGLARVSHLGTFARTTAAAAAMSLLVLQFYPDTIGLTREWIEKVTSTSDSPKRMAVEGAASIMEDPKNLLIGTGVGQYCSRAALISSDEYLNVKLPSFMTGRSDYFNEHIQPGMLVFEESGEGSAIAKPYMSAVSLPVEFGLLLSILFLAIICNGILWCARVMTRHEDELGWIGYTMMVGTVFFVFCCFIENYAEFSQAVFVPFILFVVAGSRARTLLRDATRDESWLRMNELG